MGKQTKKPEDLAKAAEMIRRGEPIHNALLAAGYSEHVAKKGRAGITGPLREALGEASKHLIEKGKKLDPRDLKHLLVGSLVENVERGEDRAHQSLKMLGSLKEVSAFEKDSVAGVVVIEMPRSLPSMDDLPTLEGELVETKALPESTQVTDE